DGEYSDFVLQCQFQQSDDADGAIGIRCVSGEKIGNTPHHLAVKLRRQPVPKFQVETGSLYYWGNTAEPPARRANLRPVGTWNDLVIDLRGQRLRVTVNGEEIQDLDLNRIAKRPQALPGVKRTSGRLGLQQHSGETRFRDF